MMRPFLLDYVANQRDDAGVPHAVFERGLYNLNIIGIRTADDSANTFNDRLACVYRDESGWICREWPITTDPGLYFRERPMNVNGTAIMKCGQYRGSHKLGKHRGQYTALVQTGGRVKYWRDSNRDAILDMDPDTEAEGYIGLNIHRASSRDGGSTTVDRWSAGCQVFADPDDFDTFIELCEKSAALYGSKFTYTLIAVAAT